MSAPSSRRSDPSQDFDNRVRDWWKQQCEAVAKNEEVSPTRLNGNSTTNYNIQPGCIDSCRNDEIVVSERTQRRQEDVIEPTKTDYNQLGSQFDDHVDHEATVPICDQIPVGMRPERRDVTASTTESIDPQDTSSAATANNDETILDVSSLVLEAEEGGDMSRQGTPR